MCGIAGYNASPAWVDKYMTEEKSFKVLEQCWLHNEHRGRDAAGYMRVDAVDQKPYVRKKEGPAADLLDDNAVARVLSPSLVLGAHTRHATVGDAKDNVNNHPVEYGQLLVTHNGTITNDRKFKAHVPRELKPSIGEVDSYAIPIALNVVDDPHDLTQILEVLPKLEGKMAIHAVWKNFPGVSLLARGPGSPLHVRWNAKEAFFAYASEEDALVAMIEETGMDMDNEDEWEYRRFDEFTALIVEYGVPVLWGSYKKAGWSPGLNKLDYWVQRIFQGNREHLVSEHDSKHRWDATFEGTSLKRAKKAKATKLIFTAKQGFREEKTKVTMPFTQSESTFTSLMEADRIYEHKTEPLLYATYGPIEVIVGQKDGKLKDVYNHREYPGIERRIIESKERPAYEADNPQEFRDWLLKSTTVVHSPMKVRTVPKFTRPKVGNVTRLPTNPTSAGVKIQNTQPSLPAIRTNDQVKSGADIYNPHEWPFPPDVIELMTEIGWEDLKDYTLHKTAPMGFIHDRECKAHAGIKYSDHASPENCEDCVLASIGFASALTDVSIWYELDTSIGVVTRNQKTEDGHEISCYDSEGYGCQFEPYLFRQVKIGMGADMVDQVMEVMVGEQCPHCKMKMFIRRLPHYMEEWTGDANYVT